MPGTGSDNPLSKLTSLEMVYALATVVITSWVGWAAAGAGVPAGFVIFWCVGIINLIVATRFPTVGVYVFIALAYGMPRYHRAFLSMVQLGVPNWVCGLALLGGLIWLIQGRRRLWPGGCLAPLMVMLVLWLIVTVVAAAIRGQPWQPHPRHHPQQYLQALVMFFVACHTLTGPDQAWRCALVICLALCGRGMLAGREGLYLEGDISALCVMAMPIAMLGFVATPQRRLKVGFLSLLAMLMALLSFTYNRAAAVGFVGLLVVLWALSRYRWRMLAISLPLLLLAGTLFTSSYYWQRFTGIWEGTTDRNSVLSRFRIWQAGWRMFVEHPVLGVGAGHFHNLVQDYNPDVQEAFAGHNNFVQILAEAGAPGLVLYTLLYLAGLATLWRTASITGRHWPGPGARLLSASLWVYLIVGCFISRQDMVLPYLLLGWAAAMRHQTPDRQPLAIAPSATVARR